MGITKRIKIKNFSRLPQGICSAQKKYFGKMITARRVPIIIGYVWEQIDPLQESVFGKWVWRDEHIQQKRKGKS